MDVHPFGVVPTENVGGKENDINCNRGVREAVGAIMTPAAAFGGIQAATHNDESFLGCERRDELNESETMEQTRLLGTAESSALFIQRLEGKNPSCGLWVDRSRLLLFLTDREKRRKARRALPLSLLGFLSACTSVIMHARMSVARNTVKATEDALGSDALFTSGNGGVPPTPDAAWTWLEGRAENHVLAPGLRAIGGMRLSRAHIDIYPVAVQILCDYSAWNFVTNVIADSNIRPKEMSSPSSCGNHSENRFWQPWALRLNDAQARIEATRRVWRANASALKPGGVVVETLAYNSEAESYALHEISLRLDPSGLALAKKSTTVFDSRPAWLKAPNDFVGRQASQVVSDGILAFVAILLVTTTLGRCCCRCCRRRRIHRKAERAIAILDIIIFIIWILFAVHRAYGGLLTEGLNNIVGGLPHLDEAKRYSVSQLSAALSNATSSEALYLHKLDVVLGQARRIGDSADRQTWNGALLVACFCLRSLWALRGWTRLSGTLHDISAACVEILHIFFILGVAVLPTLAVTGHLVLGDRLEAFSDMHTALKTTLVGLFSRAGAGAEFQQEVFWASDSFDIGRVFEIIYALCFGSLAIFLLPGLFAAALLGASVIRRQEKNRQALEADNSALVARAAHSDQKSYASWQTKLQPPSGLTSNELARSRALANAKFSELRVLEALADTETHPTSKVSSTSLAEALGATTWAEREHLHNLISQAGVAVVGHGDVKAVPIGRSPSEAATAATLRICTRLDTNAAELVERLRPLEASMRKSESHSTAVEENNLGSSKHAHDLETSANILPRENFSVDLPIAIEADVERTTFVDLANVSQGALEAATAVPPPPQGDGRASPYTCTEPELDVEELVPPPPPIAEEEIPLPRLFPLPFIGGRDAALLLSFDGASTALEEHTKQHLAAMQERFTNYAAASEERWSRMRESCARFEGRLMAMHAARHRSRHMISLQTKQLNAIEKVIDGVAKGVDPVFSAVVRDLDSR